MQLSTAMAWLLIGTVLGNIWVALAAIMAVCFVLGMVRWHQRQDLEIRFPDGWSTYCANVPEWLPRWRPWSRAPAKLTCDETVAWHRLLVFLLERFDAHDLEVDTSSDTLTYLDVDKNLRFDGVAAFATAINHTNFGFTIVAAGILVVTLPFGWIAKQANGITERVRELRRD